MNTTITRDIFEQSFSRVDTGDWECFIEENNEQVFLLDIVSFTLIFEDFLGDGHYGNDEKDIDEYYDDEPRLINRKLWKTWMIVVNGDED